MQQVAGRIRAVVMPLDNKRQPIGSIITDIAQGILNWLWYIVFHAF
jgi:hypothetical protein